MKYYCFVNWKPADLADVLKARIPAALAEFDAGNRKPLHDLEIATTKNYFDLGGWRFLYDGYINRYWVKTKYNGIVEYYAMNKSAIKKQLKSHALEIIKVD